MPAILSAKGKTVFERDLPAEPDAFLDAVQPFLKNLVVGCECMFAWYWLADLCEDKRIPFVLGHALAMKHIHGGKAKSVPSGSISCANLPHEEAAAAQEVTCLPLGAPIGVSERKHAAAEHVSQLFSVERRCLTSHPCNQTYHALSPVTSAITNTSGNPSAICRPMQILKAKPKIPITFRL